MEEDKPKPADSVSAACGASMRCSRFVLDGTLTRCSLCTPARVHLGGGASHACMRASSGALSRMRARAHA